MNNKTPAFLTTLGGLFKTPYVYDIARQSYPAYQIPKTPRIPSLLPGVVLCRGMAGLKKFQNSSEAFP